MVGYGMIVVTIVVMAIMGTRDHQERGGSHVRTNKQKSKFYRCFLSEPNRGKQSRNGKHRCFQCCCCSLRECCVDRTHVCGYMCVMNIYSNWLLFVCFFLCLCVDAGSSRLVYRLTDSCLASCFCWAVLMVTMMMMITAMMVKMMMYG